MKLLALFGMLVCCATADDLTGRVIEDHSGAAMASVEVRVARDGLFELVADLDTDSQGRFHAADLPAGEYRLEFVKENYVPAKIRVRVGGDPLVVRMVRLGILSGRVLDASGAPIANARILIAPKDAPDTYKPNGDYPQTNRQGQYRIHDLEPGQYTVAASYSSAASGSGVRFYPDNARPQIFEITGGDDYRNIDFVLIASPQFKVSGVVEPSGMVYAVALAPVEQPNFPIANRMATGLDGKFSFDSIPPGSYYVFASGPARVYMQSGSMLGENPVYARTRIQVIGQDVDGVTLPVGPGAPVAFVLRAAASAPGKACSPTAELTLRPLEAWGAVVERTQQLSIDKEQVLKNVAPGKYRMTLAKLGDVCYVLPDRVIDLTAPDRATIAIEIAPAGSVRGRLTGATTPAGFTIVLAPAASRSGIDPIQFAVPDTMGQFHFDGLRPGSYRLAVRATSEAATSRWIANLTHMVEIDVPGGTPTDLDLPAPAPPK